MENKISKYIAASYTLYDVTDGKKEVIEQTVDKRPFDFLSGFGITIPAFEEALVNLNKGEHFDFTLTPDQAYGDHTLAGKTLNFVGEIAENREATNEEISKFMNMLSGEGGCSGCGGSCGEGGCESGGEGCCGGSCGGGCHE